MKRPCIAKCIAKKKSTVTLHYYTTRGQATESRWDKLFCMKVPELYSNDLSSAKETVRYKGSMTAKGLTKGYVTANGSHVQKDPNVPKYCEHGKGP